MISLFLVSPANGQKTYYKHGIVGGVADKSAFVVNLGYFPHFKAKQHSPSKDQEIGWKTKKNSNEFGIKISYSMT